MILLIPPKNNINCIRTIIFDRRDNDWNLAKYKSWLLRILMIAAWNCFNRFGKRNFRCSLLCLFGFVSLLLAIPPVLPLASEDFVDDKKISPLRKYLFLRYVVIVCVAIMGWVLWYSNGFFSETVEMQVRPIVAGFDRWECWYPCVSWNLHRSNTSEALVTKCRTRRSSHDVMVDKVSILVSYRTCVVCSIERSVDQ